MELQTAKGVRDIAPQEKLLKNKIVDLLTKTFELYGFPPLETPILERYETLCAKFGAGVTSDALKETFKLQDQGGRNLGLRFDLTVPLARFMAMNPNLKMPFKRYEIGKVFRDGPLKLGRYREFWQCDIEIVGTSSMLADAEILAVVSTIFQKLNLEIVIKVNNRKVLSGILNQVGIGDKESAIIAIDKLDKIGKIGVTAELKERGYSQKQIENLFMIIAPGISLSDLSKKVTDSEGREGIKELEELFTYLANLNVENVIFDVSLARGLAYYTGSVFEAFLKEGKITSSLAGGGRWDDMIGKFMGSSQSVPAVGISFGLDTIFDALKEKDPQTQKTPAKVYIIPLDTLPESLALAAQLRKADVPTEISLGKKGMSKNLEYASSLGIPYVIILGENELKEKKFLLRDMQSGNQEKLSLKELLKKLSG